MNSQTDESKLDLIKAESPAHDPQAEERSLAEEQTFKKKTPTEHSQFLQEKMRERNERRIERYEEETLKLRNDISFLKDETKDQHGELEKLRERSSWRSWISGFSIVLAGIGAVTVKGFDKSDTSLHWGFTGHAWFLFGLTLIVVSVLLNFFLTVRKN